MGLGHQARVHGLIKGFSFNRIESQGRFLQAEPFTVGVEGNFSGHVVADDWCEGRHQHQRLVVEVPHLRMVQFHAAHQVLLQAAAAVGEQLAALWQVRAAGAPEMSSVPLAAAFHAISWPPSRKHRDSARQNSRVSCTRPLKESSSAPRRPTRGSSVMVG